MKKLLFILAISLSGSLLAQQDFTIYNLEDIPQSSYSNPSNRFNGNWYIGLPAMSSNYLMFSNSGFAYSDAIKKRGDSLLLDFNSMIDELGDDNYLSFHSKIDILSFGLSIGDRTQLMVNISENASFKLSYPKDLIRFIYEGNASFEDNSADLDGIGLSLNHYREYSVAISHQLTEKLRLGARAKYLYGMENIYTEKSEMSVRTDPETFAITAQSDLSVKTAGIDGVEDNDEETMDYLTGRSNSGFALDLGGQYELNDKISLSASVLDLGFIKWKDYTTSYSNNGEFEYSGIEINGFADDDKPEGETSFDRVADSLEEALNIDTTYGEYTAPLTGRFYIGANYKLNDRSYVGGIIQSEVFQSSIKPSFTALYNRKMTKWITLGASYTIINRSYNNLGLALNLNPGPVQFYVITDNILGTFQPQHTRHLQVRFGINLIFGSDKSTEIRPPFKGTIKKKSNNKNNDDNSEE